MKATTEVEIKVGGRITSFTEIDERLTSFTEIGETDKEKEVTTDMQDDRYVLVEASKLSLDDEFMRYEPQTKTEKVFKELLTKEIQRGIADFYWLRYGSSFNADGSCATLKNGDTPIVGKSYNWWEKVENEFMFEQRARSMRVAYIGVIIKKLVEDEKWSVAKAWDAVCNDSKELGHNWNSSEDPQHDSDTATTEEAKYVSGAATAHYIDFTSNASHVSWLELE